MIAVLLKYNGLPLMSRSQQVVVLLNNFAALILFFCYYYLLYWFHIFFISYFKIFSKMFYVIFYFYFLCKQGMLIKILLFLEEIEFNMPRSTTVHPLSLIRRIPICRNNESIIAVYKFLRELIDGSYSNFMTLASYLLELQYSGKS